MAGRTVRPRVGTAALELVLLVVLTVLLVRSVELSEAARRFPVLVIGATMLLILLDLAVTFIAPLRRRLRFLNADVVEAPSEFEAQARAADADDDPTPARGHVSEWVALVVVCAFGVSMYLFGYVITSPLFVAGISIWRRVPMRVWVATTVALILLNALLYEVFRIR